MVRYKINSHSAHPDGHYTYSLSPTPSLAHPLYHAAQSKNACCPPGRSVSHHQWRGPPGSNVDNAAQGYRLGLHSTNHTLQAGATRNINQFSGPLLKTPNLLVPKTIPRVPWNYPENSDATATAIPEL